MSVYNEPLKNIIEAFSSNKTNGLSTQKATALLQKYGKNKLKEKKKKSLLSNFFAQFKDAMIIILIVAAVVSFAIAIIHNNTKDFFEPALIIFIVIVNAVMGVFQESKAEKALDALQNIAAPHARVIRDSKEQIIDASLLVPGDIICLEAGDFVPADARLIKSSSLKSEEAALTGESVPSEKDAAAIVEDNAPIGDRTNMVFSGCSVTYGTAVAIVTATGMNTEMGKIANLLNNETDTQTPLQKKLTQLGKYLGIIALIACAIVFVVGLINNKNPLEIFMIAVSLAVSAIPEGLPVVVTIVLSIGVQRMVKKNALIRRLPAVETLGSASVICSDKTGTLTQNRMTLTKAYFDLNEIEDITTNCSDKIKKLLTYATLCCDGSVVIENGTEQHIGDPTETSIVLAAYKNGILKDEINQKYPRIASIPFDSDRKLMTTVNNIEGKNIVIVKGAFDVMAGRCINGNLEKAKLYTEELSKGALRVLAVGYKEIDTIPENITPEELENGLTFMGLVGMIDPPRPEAKEAVAICKKAGIKPVMITGDHIVTATAIAKEIGIYTEGDLAITGTELDSMSDEELYSKVENISVYARVSPENKIRIVKAWQRKGQVVSMTGDGVNDAPALKAADIGCAMGITGTDVAKGASDMTLTDDNFATIVDAVREGRGIYANLKKVIGFLLGTNVSEIITVFFSMMVWNTSPFLSMHLLWINLISDSLPAIALGMEPIEKDIMNKKPKPKNEGIFANGLGLKIILQGIMFSIFTLIGFCIVGGHKGNFQDGSTMAFIILALSQAVHTFNMRSDHSVFKIGIFSNKYVNLSFVTAITLTCLVLFTPLRTLFKLSLLQPKFYLIAVALFIAPLIVIEAAKLITHLIKKKN